MDASKLMFRDGLMAGERILVTGGGTGLGLAIVKELTNRMGGQISFDSDTGQGSCFYLDFLLE